MADNVTVDNAALTDYLVSADEVIATGELLQRVKLAYSADGVATHVTADADGLLVNLGANNDVTVTGTVDLGATDNAVLDDIAAKLATIDADTSALAGAVGGTEVQVDIVAALPAGTNAIGKLAANSGVDIGDVDVTSIVPGTGATNLGKAEDAAHASGHVGVMALTVRTNTAAARAGTDGDYQPLITDTNGRLHVIEPSAAGMLTALQLLDNAISGNEMQVDVLTLPNVTLAAGTNTNEVVGDAAHGAAVAGNPLLQGLEGRSTAPTAVDSGDVVRALASLLGKQVVYPYAIPAETWQYAGPTGGITDTADDAIQAAGGAGVRHYVTSLTVVNSHATVSTEVVVKDGSTVIHRGYAAAAGGGYALTFPTPLRGTAATALNVACITTGSATVVSASGYSAAE